MPLFFIGGGGGGGGGGEEEEEITVIRWIVESNVDSRCSLCTATASVKVDTFGTRAR